MYIFCSLISGLFIYVFIYLFIFSYETTLVTETLQFCAKYFGFGVKNYHNDSEKYLSVFTNERKIHKNVLVTKRHMKEVALILTLQSHWKSL